MVDFVNIEDYNEYWNFPSGAAEYESMYCAYCDYLTYGEKIRDDLIELVIGITASSIASSVLASLYGGIEMIPVKKKPLKKGKKKMRDIRKAMKKSIWKNHEEFYDY